MSADIIAKLTAKYSTVGEIPTLTISGGEFSYYNNTISFIAGDLSNDDIITATKIQNTVERDGGNSIELQKNDVIPITKLNIKNKNPFKLQLYNILDSIIV